MARPRNPSGRLSSGPWTYDDLWKALTRAGWAKVGQNSSHVHLSHPTRNGKIQLDKKWTAVKTSHWTFKGVAAQGGYSPKELQRILNGRP